MQLAKYEEEIAAGFGSCHVYNVVEGTHTLMSTLMCDLGLSRKISRLADHYEAHETLSVLPLFKLVVFDMEWKKALASEEVLKTEAKVPDIHESVKEEKTKLFLCGLNKDQIELIWCWIEHLAEALGDSKFKHIEEVKSIHDDVLTALAEAARPIRSICSNKKKNGQNKRVWEG